jgi:methylmalonyl-CoA/ethylmalonyl-CoA epimerase
MKLHHIGIACRDIDEEIRSIAKINTIREQSAVFFDEEQNAQVVLLSLADGTQMELVAGKQVETMIRMNINFYHLCFEVDDLDAEITRLVNDGAFLISPPKPAILFNKRLVAFLKVSYGIIELLSST